VSETTTTDITDITTVVDTYLAMWNEPDPAARAALVGAAWAADGHYVDPVQEARGHDALSDMVAAVHQQFPGQVFTRTSEVDTHHEAVRFGWQLGDPDGGTVSVAGLDVGQLAPDGRFRQIVGFFGDLPS
jgi:hypothetical protein